jgi:flagellar biosynthesis protein FlhF
VRIVTIDRFRIAAFEQIEKYAKVMGIQSNTAESAEDIQEILKLDEGRLDVLLIDTIGYSPNDYEGIAKMREIFDVPGLNPEIYLAVSACTKVSDLQNILRNYESFDYKSVIVTKCDETDHIGNVVSVLSEKNKFVTYITNGQKVPKHIEDASPESFLCKLTGFSVRAVSPGERVPLRSEK